MNNTKLHEEASRLVDRDVVYCVSSLIYELAQKEEYMDDLMPVLSQPQYTHTFKYECGCGHEWEIEDDEPRTEEMSRYSDIPEGKFQANCPECKEPNEPTDVTSDDTDPIEALEHWIVSNWLAGKLEAKGEMVVRDFLGLTIWGRTTSGQAISIDSVIEEIAKEML